MTDGPAPLPQFLSEDTIAQYDEYQKYEMGGYSREIRERSQGFVAHRRVCNVNLQAHFSMLFDSVVESLSCAVWEGWLGRSVLCV
jgi:hypothetical protein